ncbi:MAG: 6-hydroxymethylpterin diphosphokinase MptE-like protein [Planctomycetota bacterium]|nr:6-hydroxymethylpterin diphosphokinase MptE-like protein [Planctomycetota bacterium]
MPSATMQTHLAANLAGLGERNADIARQIEAAAPDPAIRFTDAADGSVTASLDGLQLASRHRPLEEARRLADTVDVVDHAVVIVLGFGLGYHVQALARRLGKTGIIVVFEPNVPLLRAALERIDHSAWLGEALLVFVTDPADRAALGGKLNGAESILAQGVTFLEHPPSRRRLAGPVQQFRSMFLEYVTTARTTLMTTLVRSVDTVRNLMHNVDHYVGGRGVAELEDAAAGFPAVVVSAGPSLKKNVHLLAEPDVRDRCVIIAVQTTLKPLLEAGVRPHFVTALDYHEISRRFYEGLTADDVEGVTLLADPKAHPSILDAFPGPVRCCAAPFLDRVLGDLKREMGELPAGATVAHLAVYFARYLGCNPIAMIGQDLGFPDGLYYAPGTAIHDIWAPELNPFNTIAMMEWQRIVRHRRHLHRTADVHGRSIYTDAQMLTYLQQFERDFAAYAEEGVQIIDATEGGVAKQHTTARPLREVLRQHATRPLPALPAPASVSDEARMKAAEARLSEVQRDVARLRETSRKTAAVLRRMLEHQADAKRMAGYFEKIERHRRQVEEMFQTFELLNHLNQLGVFKRMKADRRLHMQQDLDAVSRQRAQLERDLVNVVWIADAAEEFIAQLDDARRILRRERIGLRPRPTAAIEEEVKEGEVAVRANPRVAVLVPVDPDRNALGLERSLAEPFDGRPVMQATLERLGSCRKIESIILIAPHGFDAESLIDRARIGLPVHIERCHGSPFGPERQAIATARLWADTSWRGGIAGASVYDEALCPPVMYPVMQRRGLTAALIAAPDWPLIDATDETGCDGLVARYLEYPGQHNIVFTQAPPGLSGCVVSTSLMGELSQRTRLSTIGGLLTYQPHAPQADPIARDANVQIDHVVRRSLIRATFDSPRQHRLLRRALDRHGSDTASPAALVSAIEEAGADPAGELPRHVILELTTQRADDGLIARHPCGLVEREPLPRALAGRVFEELGAAGDCVLTFAGVGDPLLHDEFDVLIGLAREAGIRAIHVRTTLLADRATLDRLLACGVDVISVDLHADRAVTYEMMLGVDRFKDVLLNMQYILDHRRHLAGPAGTGGLALPWLVPRLRRCAQTYEDLESFYERWQHMLGTAVIEAPPPFPRNAGWPGDELSEAVTPSRVMHRETLRRMTIFSDGSVPVSELDLHCERSAGNVAVAPVHDVWRSLVERRLELQNTLEGDAPELRTYQP